MSRIPAGTYRARAFETKHGETKKGGIEIAIAFKILNEDFAGTTITGYVYFTENTDDDRGIESLEACGWDGTNISVDPLPGLGSCETELVVEIENYEGKDRSKVKWINKVGAVSTSTPLTDEKRRIFEAKMQAKVAARKARNGSSTGAQPGNSAGDDIPF